MLGVELVAVSLGILGTLGQVGGVTGIALGLVTVVFRDLLRKVIFPKLDDNQAFRLLRLIALLTWSLGLVGLGTSAYGVWVEHADSQAKEEIVFGIVTQEDGKEVADARVEAVVRGDLVAQDRTTTSGRFRLTLAKEVSPITIVVTQVGFERWHDLVSIPQSEVRIVLRPSTNVHPTAPTNTAPSVPYRKLESVTVKMDCPGWEQVRADLAKGYTDVNGVEIVKFGAQQQSVKSDGTYCQQTARVTIKSVDGILRCNEVIAGYKLAKDQWHFNGVKQEEGGCSN